MPMATDAAALAAVAERRRIANGERVAGRYAAAEATLLAAIEAASAAFGDGDVTVAVLRNDLAVTYKYAGRLADAETLYRQALPVLEATFGPGHPEVATVWHNLGGIPGRRRGVALRERCTRSPSSACSRRSAGSGPSTLGSVRLARLSARSAPTSIINLPAGSCPWATGEMLRRQRRRARRSAS